MMRRTSLLRFKPSVWILLVCSLLLSESVAAQVFTDEASFLAALGPGAVTYEFDEFSHDSSLTNELPGLIFVPSATAWDALNFPFAGTFESPPNVLLNFDVFGGSPIRFEFDPPVIGVGLYNTSLVDRVELTLFDGNGQELFSGELPEAVVNYLGYISDVPIAAGEAVGIPPTNGSIYIDGLSFKVGVPAVPTLGRPAMVGLALALLVMPKVAILLRRLAA